MLNIVLWICIHFYERELPVHGDVACRAGEVAVSWVAPGGVKYVTRSCVEQRSIGLAKIPTVMRTANGLGADSRVVSECGSAIAFAPPILMPRTLAVQQFVSASCALMWVLVRGQRS